MKKNFSMYGLPEKVIFCSKCVMSNQRPRSVVEFKNHNNQKSGLNIDKDSSICDACNYNETKKKLIGIKEKTNYLIFSSFIANQKATIALCQVVAEKIVLLLHMF